MLMPLTGGTPRPFLSEGADSPPGLQTAHASCTSTTAAGDPLFVADRTGADARQISSSDATGFFGAACTTTIRSGHQTASGSTSCTGWNRPTRWTCGAFDRRADRRSN